VDLLFARHGLVDQAQKLQPCVINRTRHSAAMRVLTPNYPAIGLF
jgi:hypothetical protein